MNNSSYFNPEFETMSREQIEALQLERLQKTVRHCMNNEFYQKKFKEAGITPDDIKTLADVRKLPFTTKQDLRETYPFGMSCVPLRDCVRLHSSSGTTGNPTNHFMASRATTNESSNASCVSRMASSPS